MEVIEDSSSRSDAVTLPGGWAGSPRLRTSQSYHFGQRPITIVPITLIIIPHYTRNAAKSACAAL